MEINSNNKAIWIALFANLSIFTVKFISSRIAGSAAMFSEALHSLADLFSSIFLLVGLKLSLRPPDDEHPFGYGKEVYFWSFVASVFMLGVTSTGSITKGYHQLMEGEAITNFTIPLIALLISIVFEFFAVYFAVQGVLRDVNCQVKGWRMFPYAVKLFRQVTNPAIKFVFFEDLAALAGVIIAFIALAVAEFTGIFILDGIASIIIGLILGVLALLLAFENRELILGRSAQDNVEQAIGDLAMKVRHVQDVHSLKTMYVGPRNLLVNMEVEVNPQMRVDQTDEVIEDIENVLRHHLPIARHFSIEILADDQQKDWYTKEEIRLKKPTTDDKQKVYRRK